MTTRIGVIGVGKMGLLHSAILNSLNNCKVVAMVDTEKLVLEFVKRYTKEIQVFSDYQDMLENALIDVVYITTPVKSHIPIAKSCIEYRKHFFVEKPLGINSLECKELCNIIKPSVKNMVGFYLRYSPTFSKAKIMLSEGVIGKLNFIESSVFQTQKTVDVKGWRFDKTISGGGVLIDLGVYLIDLLRWFFGEIIFVESKEILAKNYIDESFIGIVEFENGLNAKIEASWRKLGHRLQETTIKVEGSIGTLIVNEDYVKITYNDKGKKDNLKDNILFRQELQKGVPIDIGGSEYTLEDVDFMNCIQKDKMPESDIRNASKIQTVIDSLYQASIEKSKKKAIHFE